MIKYDWNLSLLVIIAVSTISPVPSIKFTNKQQKEKSL
jgi:hypothetical protein